MTFKSKTGADAQVEGTRKKVAIITAGGSGMGAATARRLAQDSFHVAILSSSGKGEAIASELGGIGVTGSNQSNEDLKRLVDKAVEKWGRIDVLVNSAGHGPRAPLLEITDEEWHAGLDVYFLNVVRAARLVAPIMVAQKGGAIVNISTAWVAEPNAMFPTSAVARAGLAIYTKLFADQFAADNVRMNNVLPGWIDSLPTTDERRSSVPMKRYGTSEEIASTVAFLVSDGAGYITGQSIRIDGGTHTVGLTFTSNQHNRESPAEHEVPAGLWVVPWNPLSAIRPRVECALPNEEIWWPSVARTIPSMSAMGGKRTQEKTSLSRNTDR